MSNPNCFTICMLLLFMGLGSMLPFGETRNIPSYGFACMTIDAPVDSKTHGRAGWIHTRYRWTTMKVYIEDSFTSGERAMIHEALEKLRKILPCVTIEAPTSIPDGDYVHVTRYNSEGCYSDSIGRAGGKQEINLDYGCRNNRTIIHELFHALGVEHEHNRADRDEYVTINWENIADGYEHAFEKVSADEFSNFGVPYNTQSIMHYPSQAFSWNDKPTILTKDGAEIEYQTILQDTDILKLQKMYGCSK